MSIYDEKEFTDKFNPDLWKKLLSFAKPYLKEFIILSAIMIFVAVIDAVFPLLTRYAIDNFVIPKNYSGIGKFAAIYFTIVVIQAVNVYLLIVFAGKIELGISYTVRKQGFRKLQELSFSYYDVTPVGWIMARMTSDAQKLGETISWGLVDILWGFFIMFSISVFMLIMNWKLALIVMVVIPPLIVISRYFQQKILSGQRVVRKTNSKISGAYNEGLIGAKTTKILVREDENLKEFQDLTGQMRAASIRTAVFAALFLPAALTLGSIGTALALWIGGKGVVFGVLSYGSLVAFLSYTVQFFEPVQELARVLAELQSAQASAERIISMIETEPDVKDKPEIIERYGTSFMPEPENWQEMKGDIEFINVDFAYKTGEEVLKGFNLKVNSGQTIALIGETGCGKSTIVNIACRFYEPTAGKVLIDGIDYRERSILWLHSSLGYVLQQPHLFSGNIRENIRYGRLDASDKEVEEAAKLVNADRFILRMNNGYGSEVGECGGLLSTGEKQLVSFARAVLADPVLFILDEATSSIDTETEMLIQNAIQHVLKNRTSFIIAHRLSTIKNADRILLLKKGRIIEDGDHRTLLKKKGDYYKLYTNQFMEEREKQLLGG